MTSSMSTENRSNPEAASVVTVTDVAREAGVSVSTVSRIVNGTARVAVDKRLAVEAAIARMDFRPNLHARSLKMGRSMTIGMLAQDIESPFFTRVIRGIEEGLKGSGYAPIIVSGHWNQSEEIERVGLLMARRIDGLVILNGSLADEQIVDIARRQPVVATGRRLEGYNLKTLRLDNELGGYMAASHLLSLGHRRIAHISGPESHEDAVDRYAGFVRAHQEHGLDVDPGIVFQGGFLETGGVLAMTRLLDSGKNFTAVFAANDQSAMGARLVLHRRGIREDISLMGFDDIPATEYLTPPLTTVRQPFYEIGLYLAQTLLTMLGRDVPEVTIPGMELVIRETVKRCFQPR
jgi:LacI family transcriptional regulator